MYWKFIILPPVVVGKGSIAQPLTVNWQDLARICSGGVGSEKPGVFYWIYWLLHRWGTEPALISSVNCRIQWIIESLIANCTLWISRDHAYLSVILWRRGVVVITTAQLYSTKPELTFCAGSNPAHGVSEIWDGDDLWQWSWVKIRLNGFC